MFDHTETRQSLPPEPRTTPVLGGVGCVRRAAADDRSAGGFVVAHKVCRAAVIALFDFI